MKNYDLSVIIPARNEEFLARTVEDVLVKKQGKTEVIVILDGHWASPPVVNHPDVTVIYHSQSIGQRAATNEGCRLSKAKYIMKLDGHCILDEGFDVKLMADCKYDWTVIPRMYNLHAFDRVCPKCKHRLYQGPEPINCEKCGTKMVREMVWKVRWHKRSDFMRFDTDLHFQYFGALGHRLESQGDIADTMSFVGACWFMYRQRYLDIDGLEESWGSWGQVGTEISCKSWLSGGRLVVNKKTWFCHLFRTQGGSFGFPYPQSGNQVARARKKSQDVFLNNKWFKQVKPLSWLIEKFKPLPGWHDKLGESRLRQVTDAGTVFSRTHPLANSTDTFSIDQISSEQNTSIKQGVSSSTVSFSTSEHILRMCNKSNMTGITTPSVTTNKVVKFKSLVGGDGSNQPSIHQTVDTNSFTIKEKSTISSMIQQSSPVPTSSSSINLNISKKTSDGFSIKDHGSNIPQIMELSKGIIYYTDNALNMKIAHRCRQQILKSGLPIVSVSLKPLNFGKNIVLKLKRSYEAYFKQILTALENSTADIIYFCEHDWLYSPDHFRFTPSRKDVYYYNDSWWRLRLSDGHAISYDTHMVPSICAYRELLLNHYRKCVEVLSKSNWDKNLVYAIGFEPGTHNRKERVDEYKAEGFKSAYPNLDLRHDNNLTRSKWKQSDFRNPRSCQGWIENDTEIIPWGKNQDIIKMLGVK